MPRIQRGLSARPRNEPIDAIANGLVAAVEDEGVGHIGDEHGVKAGEEASRAARCNSRDHGPQRASRPRLEGHLDGLNRCSDNDRGGARARCRKPIDGGLADVLGKAVEEFLEPRRPRRHRGHAARRAPDGRSRPTHAGHRRHGRSTARSSAGPRTHAAHEERDPRRRGPPRPKHPPRPMSSLGAPRPCTLPRARTRALQHPRAGVFRLGPAFSPAGAGRLYSQLRRLPPLPPPAMHPALAASASLGSWGSFRTEPHAEKLQLHAAGIVASHIAVYGRVASKGPGRESRAL